MDSRVSYKNRSVIIALLLMISCWPVFGQGPHMDRLGGHWNNPASAMITDIVLDRMARRRSPERLGTSDSSSRAAARTVSSAGSASRRNGPVGTRLNSNAVALSAALQARNVSGRYVYKTHREGKGGFDNSLEISNSAPDRFHISFEGTYFYMAGREETFHEGSGEGDGQLAGNVMTATLDDGSGGSCPLSLTFNQNQVTLSSESCRLNVIPDGVYRREAIVNSTGSNPRSDASSTISSRPGVAQKARGFEVCPDPKAPCRSAMREFATFELPFRLPARLKARRQYKSVPFYAVIVRTYENEECDAEGYTTSIERERLKIQKTYSSRKVFGSYDCPDMDAISYDFAGRMDASGEKVLLSTFIAVYAGKTPAEANEFLAYTRTLFPQAKLKRMIAIYEIINQ